MGKSFICPKCNKIIEGYPAISRKDNKTEICPICGLIEALDAFNNKKEKGTIIVEVNKYGRLEDRR